MRCLGSFDYVNDRVSTVLLPWQGHEDVVQTLLAAGCQLDASDKDGTTALMAAASNGHLSAVEKLVKAGAALDKQNADGHNALMFAYNGKAQVDRESLKAG